MARFLVWRLLWMIPVLLTISAITFILMHLTPGGPWDQTEGHRTLPAQVVDVLNRRYHLDEPVWKQYLFYVGGVLHGDLGPSYQYRGRSVEEILFAPPPGRPIWESRFGRSATLGLIALLIAVAVGVPLGIVACLRQNTAVDYLLLLFATVGVATPSFVVAIFLLIVFGLMLHWFPVAPTDWSSPRAWVMPSIALGFTAVAFLARLTRATMLETIRQDYVRTARAKGLPEQFVIVRHAFRNSLIPLVTVLGPLTAGLLTGTFFIEYMFSFPGMGRLYVQGIGQRDYSMIMGTTLFYAFAISLANIGVDVVYGWLDPKVKVG